MTMRLPLSQLEQRIQPPAGPNPLHNTNSPRRRIMTSSSTSSSSSSRTLRMSNWHFTIILPTFASSAASVFLCSLAVLLCSLPLVQAGVTILNATTLVTPSIGNKNYDHQVILESNNPDDPLDDVLIFRWDHPVDTGILTASFEHTTNTQSNKPSWLALGFFDAFRNTVPIFDDALDQINGQAVVGTLFFATPAVFKYSLGDPHGRTGDSSVVNGGVSLMADSHQTLIYQNIEQGTVTLEDGSEAIRTVLMFAKNLDEGEDAKETTLKASGENIFTWAIGPPGMETLGMHDQRGAFRLDLSSAQKPQTTGTGTTTTTSTAPAPGPATTFQIVNGTATFQPLQQNNPSSPYADFHNKVQLDEHLVLYWANPGTEGILKARVEHKAESIQTAPSWLGFGFYDVMHNPMPVTSTNFVMDGSTAIIGTAFNFNWDVQTSNGADPRLYSLGYNHDQPGVIKPLSEQKLLSSSFLQFDDTEEGVVFTTLDFEKSMKNPSANEPPIVAIGDNIFIWAMGPPEATTFGMHSEYGALRLDLSVAASRDNESGGTTSPPIASINVVNANAQFVTSVDPSFDYQVQLARDVIFRWEAPDTETGIFTGRLEHTTKFVEAAPAWLGFGFPNPTDTSTWMLMQDTYAIIGMLPSEKVSKYSLGINNNHTTGFVQALPLEQQTLKATKMLQTHNADTGIYTTTLTFAKLLVEENNPLEAPIWTQGENRFLWAVGNALTATPTLGMHRDFGAMTVDFSKLEDKPAPVPSPPPLSPVPTSAPISKAPASKPTSSNGDVNDGSGDRYLAPVVVGQCSSTVFEKSGKSIMLTPNLIMHWIVNDADDASEIAYAEFGEVPSVTILLQYSGMAWLGFGFSSSERAHSIGSSAVIGIPTTKDTPQLKYNITATTVEGTAALSDQTLIESYVNQEQGSPGLTTLRFTKALFDGTEEVRIKKKGLNYFSFAIGSGNRLGYHQHRGSFQLDLSDCYDLPPDYDPSAQYAYGNSEGGKTAKGALTAHAVMAAIAWGFAMPCAVGMAWFRQLVPTTWIYIHVSFNLLTFVLTLLAVLVGVASVSARDGSSHFTKAHHIVGVLLFVGYTFQVGNGFLRPPVQRKDGSPVERKPFSLHKPESARELWHMIHRSMGIIMLLVGIFQIASGMKLFDQDFESGRDHFFWYWTYVSLFGLAMISLKIWLVTQNRKARGEGTSWVEDRAATSVGVETMMQSDPSGMDLDGDCVVLEIPSLGGSESTVIRGARRMQASPSPAHSANSVSESNDDDNMTVEIT